MVLVTQCKVMVVGRSSLEKRRRSASPPQSVQARNFSAIQAASPAGESASPAARVCGWSAGGRSRLRRPAAAAAGSRTPALGGHRLADGHERDHAGQVNAADQAGGRPGRC